MKKVNFLHIHLGCLGQFRKGVVALKLLLLDVQTTSVLETASNNYKKESRNQISHQYTLFKIFIFCPKVQIWFSEKILEFFWCEKSRKCCGFGLFSCWQLWFHEKNCQKKIGWKTRENMVVCQNWIFGQKFDFSNSV